MYQWTHVNCQIRQDAIKGLPGSVFSKINPEVGIPRGSEGPLYFNVWENPDDCNISAYTISIWGDLRDFGENLEDDLTSIISYLTDLTEGKLIRSGVCIVDVEYKGYFVFAHRRLVGEDVKVNVWELVHEEYT